MTRGIWRPRHTAAARKKASRVARYYKAFLNMRGFPPTLATIGRRFAKSGAWASTYVQLAREYRFLTEEDIHGKEEKEG